MTLIELVKCIFGIMSAFLHTFCMNRAFGGKNRKARKTAVLSSALSIPGGYTTHYPQMSGTENENKVAAQSESVRGWYNGVSVEFFG